MNAYYAVFDTVTDSLPRLLTIECLFLNRSFLKGKLSMAEGSTLQKRYQACMILSGAGDALGYNNGDWEFESNAEKIHKEVAEKGGLAKLDIRNFPISDDTVMHLATADALVKTGGASLKDLYGALVKEYIKCMDDMSGRAPGKDLFQKICIFIFVLMKPQLILNGCGHQDIWEF